jgi:hypothetical protein
VGRVASARDLHAQRQRLLADEQGTLHKVAQARVALCYPSPYHVGMSSLGFQTVYREIHAHPEATAERAFLPDDVESFRESRTPLFTLETGTPVGEFPVLACSTSSRCPGSRSSPPSAARAGHWWWPGAR